MAKRSTRLELTLSKLYPLYFTSVTADPVNLTVDNEVNLLAVLYQFKKSILHRCYLNDIIAIDFLSSLKSKRFQLNYSLLSYISNTRFNISFLTNLSVPSVTHIFRSASWVEREVWDLFGIFFTNSQTDLRRILTDYGFKGHPFRKDFPLVGYYELKYSEKKKRVISIPVMFQQEFRVFNLKSPWIKNIQA